MEKLLGSIRSVLSFRVSGDFRFTDVALLVLLAAIGLKGYSRFPSYETALPDLNASPPYWIALLVLFNYLLIQRKIRICFLRGPAGYAASAIVFTALSLFLQLFLDFSVDEFHFLDRAALLSSQAGLATFLLIVQGWINFYPDLTSILHQRTATFSSLRTVNRSSKLDQTALRIAQDRCEALENSLNSILLEPKLSTEIKAQLEKLNDSIKEAGKILRKPTGVMKNDLMNFLKEADHE